MVLLLQRQQVEDVEIVRLLGVTLSKFEGEEEESDTAAAPADLLSLL